MNSEIKPQFHAGRKTKESKVLTSEQHTDGITGTKLSYHWIKFGTVTSPVS